LQDLVTPLLNISSIILVYQHTTT